MSSPELDGPMGQCAVTGKMVPEDELITIQGQRRVRGGQSDFAGSVEVGRNHAGGI